MSTDYSGATVMIQMEASNPPYIRITPYEISFHAEGEMDFYAKVTNFVKVHLLKLRVVRKRTFSQIHFLKKAHQIVRGSWVGC